MCEEEWKYYRYRRLMKTDCRVAVCTLHFVGTSMKCGFMAESVLQID